jgi:hypothetical protein
MLERRQWSTPPDWMFSVRCLRVRVPGMSRTFGARSSSEAYKDVNTLLAENTDLTRTIHQLTEDLHQRVLQASANKAPTV